MNRIHKRARNMETGITADYMTLARFVSTTNGWPPLISVRWLTIQTDDLDFVHQPKHFGNSGAKNSG